MVVEKAYLPAKTDRRMAIKVMHPVGKIVDDRGVIARLIDDDTLVFRGVLHITSKKGSVRSNHYHKKDYHYLYVERGKCEYYEKEANNPNAKIESVSLAPGDLVLSKPGIIHAVKFLEDSVIWAFTTEKRRQDTYEKDTIRVTIIK